MVKYTVYPGDDIHVAEAPAPLLSVGAFEIVDRRAEFAKIVNTKPFHRDFIRTFGELATTWPTRMEVTGVTIHHTLSHSPTATAGYITRSKGYPTTQYSYWVSADDGCPVYWCLADHVACWHDHTGRLQTTMSVGMAGSLHKVAPSIEQMEACAKLCKVLMDRYHFGVDQVQGHNDRAKLVKPKPVRTDCPGWDAAGWRNAFYAILRELGN